MEPLQALSAKTHLNLLKLRINSYKGQLEQAQLESNQLKRDLKTCSQKGEEIRAECKLKREELEKDQKEQIEEYTKQIKIAQDMLDREKEKRTSLLNYLNDLNISVRLPCDLKDFDWAKLEKVFTNSDAAQNIEKRAEKARVLANVNRIAYKKINEMLDLINSTALDRNRVHTKMNELKFMAEGWKNALVNQGHRMNKLREENNRLKLLVKQCLSVNEPLSKHVMDNVRAKCHSFLNSNSSEELVTGLRKYKIRQDRIIKLLKHREKKLSKDINLLQVATDRTTDQMQYYHEIAKSNDIPI